MTSSFGFDRRHRPGPASHTPAGSSEHPRRHLRETVATRSTFRHAGALARTLAALLVPILAPPLLLVVALLVTACGGGTGEPDTTPSITSLTASAATHFVGDRAQLTAVFTGGTGRIVSDSGAAIGPVASGVPVSTAPLAAPTRFTLIVERGGQSVRRELAVSVGYRDRYVTLPGPRVLQYHAAVAAGDGTVLVIGGSRGENSVSDAIDRFDPAVRSFTRIGTLRTGRAGHTATRLADGRILVLGGVTGLQIGNVADLIDERTGAVSHGGTPLRPRNRHAAVALADGRVLVVGGWNDNTAEIWDPGTNTFRRVGNMLHSREWPTATLLADGRVLVAGGHSEALSYAFAEVFDPRTEQFTALAAPAAPAFAARRQFHAAHRLADGRVLILGGEHEDPLQERLLPLASVVQFDPAAGTLSVRGDLEAPRSVAAAVPLGDDVALFGGLTPAQAPAASAVRYRNGAPLALAAMPVPRHFHTATRMGDGRILILGGDDARQEPVTSVVIYE